MKVKHILTDSLYYGIIPKLSTLINVLVLPILTPYLTTEDYGVYGILTSYSGIAMLVAVLGLNVLLTNSFYTHKQNFRLLWGRVLFLLLLSGLICAIVYGLILWFLLPQLSGAIKLIAIISCCIPIATIANPTIAQHYYPLIYKPLPLVLRNLVASLAGIAVTFVSIYYYKLGFLGWVFGAAVAAIVAFSLFISSLWVKEKIKPIPFFDKLKIRRWLLISLPIIPHSLGFVLLSSSDRIIMDILGVPISQIGLYSNGCIMGGYAIILSSALIVAISPRLQELYRSHDFVQLKKLAIFSQAATLLFVFLVSVWMPQIYKFLIHNPTLYPANEIASLTCFANIVFPFYSFVSTVAFIREDTKKVLWLVFVPSVLNIVLNLIFIPIYGYMAAVYTTIIAYWSQLLIPYLVPYFKVINMKIFGSKKYPVFLLLIFAISIVTANFVSKSDLLVKTAFTVVIFASVCIFILGKKRKVIN